MSHVVASEIVKKQIGNQTRNRMCDIYENIEGEFPMETEWTPSFYWFRKVVNDSLFHLYDWQINPRPYDPEGILSPAEERYYCAKYSNSSLVSSLNGALKVLRRSKCGAWERNFMLRVLIHGVLDIHQPCRCANLYSSRFKFGNNSGYAYIVDYQDRIYNLVHLWDSLFGKALADSEKDCDYQNLTIAHNFAKKLMDLYPAESFSCRLDGTFEDWAEESYQLAVKEVYQGIEHTSVVSDEYAARCKPVAERQLALAAHRLTYLLEDIFGR